MGKIKLLVADDHLLFREGIKRLLEETNDMIVVDEAASGQEVLEKSVAGDFEVVLLDISMPGKNVLDTLKELKALRPELAVLILTMHPEERYAIRFLRAGAAGYLTKKNATEELVAAIQKVAGGGKYVSPSLAEKLAIELDPGIAKTKHGSLSDREYQVMCMLGLGKSLSDIAAELSLGISTVSTYRSRILEKTGLKNNAELVRYTIDNHLID